MNTFYIEGHVVIVYKFSGPHINPNGAGLLNVAWEQGGLNQITSKHCEKPKKKNWFSESS